MISRREVVTAGVLGTLSSGVAPADAQPSDAGVRQALQDIKGQLEEIKTTLHTGLVASSLSVGRVGQVGRGGTLTKATATSYA